MKFERDTFEDDTTRTHTPSGNNPKRIKWAKQQSQDIERERKKNTRTSP